MSRQWGVRRVLCCRGWITLDAASPEHLPPIRRHKFSGWAARDFHDRTVWLNHCHTGEKKQNSGAQFTLTLGEGRLEIELSDRPSKQKKAHDHSRNTKINLELHHIAHTNRRGRAQPKAGHFRNNLRTATIYRLVTPEDARNQ